MNPHRQRFLCALLAAFWFVSTAFTPILAHAALFSEFTLKKEKELGDKFNVLIRSRMPLIQDPEVVDYISGIVKRLERTMPPQPFPFTVGVIWHNAVNAFATPGGYIFVQTGLILAMNNESEVAGVIAHEMAHVTQRHIARRIENSQYVSVLSILGMLAGAFLGGDAGAAAMTGSMAAGQAAMLSYSRDDERESDQVGMNYLSKAGYPPQGMVGAFEVLSRKQWLVGSSVPTYLSTHPGLSERVKDMGIRVSRLPADKQRLRDNNTQFLRVQAIVRAKYSDPQPAAQIFSRQMKGPAKCMALMGMGILASRQNKINDATRYFDDALACAPKDPLVIREAGIFHYTKGNKRRGLGLLQQAVALSPNDVIAMFYHARALGDQGQTQAAIETTKRVLRKVPEDSEVHELLARLYGNNRQLFLANLHMAYSALFENNRQKTRQFLDKAKNLASGPADSTALNRFQRIYDERKAFWKKG
ncbi:M48 family metalloprotease [Desulfovibrio sp. OttesenSCG-928-G15]|nr:M48 family metalloprotease [Desulfovibrio sp. OttesenSCG-928-G15]